MGCFGDMTPVKDVNTTQAGHTVSGPDAWITDATQQNYGTAQNVLNRGFVPYNGEFIAPLSRNEGLASELVASKAGGNPYNDAAAAGFRNYGSAPGFNYSFNTSVDPNGPLGSVSSYMNPFIDSVLAPQLRQLGISGSQARQGINANATQAGAYGDARHGVVESEQRKNEALQGTDIVGKAFSDAYGSAMQNRQTDAARQFQTQQSQQSADAAALERARTSGIDLTNLDKYDVSRALGLAGGLGTTGGTERSVAQSADTANFNEFLRGQGFTDNQVQFLTQILAGMPKNQTSTNIGNTNAVTSQPDNSGYQLLGNLASTAAMMFL